MSGLTAADLRVHGMPRVDAHSVLAPRAVVRLLWPDGSALSGHECSRAVLQLSGHGVCGTGVCRRVRGSSEAEARAIG